MKSFYRFFSLLLGLTLALGSMNLPLTYAQETSTESEATLEVKKEEVTEEINQLEEELDEQNNDEESAEENNKIIERLKNCVENAESGRELKMCKEDLVRIRGERFKRIMIRANERGEELDERMTKRVEQFRKSKNLLNEVVVLCKHLSQLEARAESQASSDSSESSAELLVDINVELSSLLQQCEAIRETLSSEDELSEEQQEALKKDYEELKTLFKELWQQKGQERSCGLADEALVGLSDKINELKESATEDDEKMQKLIEHLEEKYDNALGHQETGECRAAVAVVHGAEQKIKARTKIRSHVFVNYQEQYQELIDELLEEGILEDEENLPSREELLSILEEKGYDLEELALIKKLNPLFVRMHLQAESEDGEDLLRFAINAELSEDQVEKLLEKRAAISQKVEEVANRRSNLRSKFELFKRYHFDEETAEEVEAYLESDAELESEGEVEGRFEAFLEKARERKHQKGLIPFRDADEDTWWGEFAARAKKRNLIQGTGTSNGAEMNPEGLTNVAELIAFMARLQGVDSSAETSSELAADLPEWAQSSAATLSNLGIDLDTLFADKTGVDLVTRAEVAVMLQTLLNLEVENTSAADAFSDIAEANEQEQLAIAAVAEAEIMTGLGSSDAFGVNDPLTRAALVKILDLAGNYSLE